MTHIIWQGRGGGNAEGNEGCRSKNSLSDRLGKL
jgi:hypothetical protein